MLPIAFDLDVDAYHCYINCSKCDITGHCHISEGKSQIYSIEAVNFCSSEFIQLYIYYGTNDMFCMQYKGLIKYEYSNTVLVCFC